MGIISQFTLIPWARITRQLEEAVAASARASAFALATERVQCISVGLFTLHSD